MKTNFSLALVVAMVGLVAVSACTKDDSMWGRESQTYQKSAPATPAAASEDVVETKANVSYVGEFEVKDVEVNTIDQNNTITTVTIKNGEETSRTTNVVRLTLEANLTNAVDVKVKTREDLEATSFHFAKKANDANEVKEGNVLKRSVKDVYTTDLKDGNVLDLSTLVESAKADTLKLLNAEFKDIKVKSVESIKNESLSSERAEVNDVTVVYEGVIVKADAEDEVFELSTSYTRTMEIAPIAPIAPAQPAFKGFAVSAVPALNENGKFVDGKGEREAHKAFVFFKENSAITVIVPMENEPTAEMVANGDVWEGDFSSCNSAYYLNDGMWKPCVAEDAQDGNGILYWDAKQIVRSVRKSSLENWNWRNGNFSTVISGYSCSFEGENMIIAHNGQVVLTLK